MEAGGDGSRRWLGRGWLDGRCVLRGSPALTPGDWRCGWQMGEVFFRGSPALAQLVVPLAGKTVVDGVTEGRLRRVFSR